MRSIKAVFLFNIFYLVLFSSLNISAEESEIHSPERLSEPITIVGAENLPPFSFTLPDGTKTGFYVEFWKLWSKTNDIPINVILGTFDKSLKAIKNNNTAHVGLFFNKNRDKWADFSHPLHSVKTSILYNSRYLKSAKLAQMKNETLGVYASSYQYQYLLKKYPSINIVGYKDMQDGVSKLLNGELHAIVVEIPIVESVLASMGLQGVFTFSDEVILINEVSSAIANGQPELLETINNGMENIPISELIALEKKWLPSSEPFYKSRIPSYALTSAEKKWLQNNSYFTVGIDPDLPPFEFIDSKGNFSGISADYINYTNRLLNINMTPVFGMTWLEAFDAFKKGEIDIMSGAIVTSERHEFMDFTVPYIDMPTAIITQRNSFYVESMENLNQKTLGLVEGDFVKYVMNDYPEINLKIVRSEVEGLNLLQAGEIDAFIAPVAVANYEIDKRKMNELIIAAISPYNLKLSIAVRKGLEPLVSILNRSFANMTEKERSMINNTWLRSYVKSGVNKQKLLTWVVPIVLIVLVFIITVVTYNNRRLKKAIEKNKLLARRIVAIQEEERRILSRDLHDEIGQNLTALQLHIKSAKQYQDLSKLNSVITTIDEIVTVTYQSAYELMHWLRPIVLDDYGLKHALSNHIFTKLLKESNIHYIKLFHGNSQLVKSELSTSIYRIVQECISNAAKHSKAKNLWVSINVVPPILKMKIEDDGIGFDVNQVEINNSGFGLRGIEDRVDAMNGTHQLVSNSKGTLHSFVFNLDEEKSS